MTIQSPASQWRIQLHDLALDLRWSWRPEIRALFRAIDPDRALTGAEDPWTVLRLAPAERLERLAADPAFRSTLERLAAERAAYLVDGGWFERAHGPTAGPLVAYFTAEVGLDEALPLYSGGLGVLSGDHLKSASSLGVPLVGVSLLYAEGYFRQQLDASGWQREYYPPNRFDLLPIYEVRTDDGRPLTVEVPLPGRPLTLAVWQARIGRVNLYLLDANVPANSPADRGITAQLYGGDRETRLQQEMALGIGGWRALAALGIRPPVCHLNEGHAAFAVLERARSWMVEHGTSFDVARVATSTGNVFTTHTPVGAGFDAFDPEVVRRYLAPYATELGVSVDDVLDLGRTHPGDSTAPLEMAVLALRFAGSANGVSRLHGEVSRRLFEGLFPRLPEREIPIGAVTNGVHVATWVSDSMRELWHLCYGEACWDQPDTADWARLVDVNDEDLWAARNRERARLVGWARARLAHHLAQRGERPDLVRAAGSVLDPAVLTIGFARRFAEYKRPTLLLSQPDRLRRLLKDPAQPVQLVVAGKAHPRDDAGKALIAEIVRFAADRERRSQPLGARRLVGRGVRPRRRLGRGQSRGRPSGRCGGGRPTLRAARNGDRAGLLRSRRGGDPARVADPPSGIDDPPDAALQLEPHGEGIRRAALPAGRRARRDVGGRRRHGCCRHGRRAGPDPGRVVIAGDRRAEGWRARFQRACHRARSARTARTDRRGGAALSRAGGQRGARELEPGDAARQPEPGRLDRFQRAACRSLRAARRLHGARTAARGGRARAARPAPDHLAAMSAADAAGRPRLTVRVRSRWDDCDRYGHVNNAAFLALVRAAHDRAGLAAGELRALEITYRQPLLPETMVDVDVAVIDESTHRLRVGYALAVEGSPSAEVIALWHLGGSPITPELPPVDRDAGGLPFRFHQTVRSYELGPDGTVRPQVILQWLEHAVFRAATRAGWPRERMVAAGFLTFVIGHHLVRGEPAREGDELVVTSRLVDLRRVSGTWHHEIHGSDGSLIAADRARGAFLDLEGRIRPAPRELLDDLLAGEPPA
ncbi:MAG: alpha-glucan family phosphorylase [Chloroflexi bacterium]|nr:alpha-glucan family phosphorylase [Chloroflexota bacterium]